MNAKEITLNSGVQRPFEDFGRSLREVLMAAMGVHVVRASPARADR